MNTRLLKYKIFEGTPVFNNKDGEMVCCVPGIGLVPIGECEIVTSIGAPPVQKMNYGEITFTHVRRGEIKPGDLLFWDCDGRLVTAESAPGCTAAIDSPE